MSVCTYLLMFLLSFSHVCLCRNYLHLTLRGTLIFRGNPVIFNGGCEQNIKAQNISEYDQDMPQSNSANQHTAP